MRTIGVSRIRSLTLKFQAPRSPSPHLSIFRPAISLSRFSVTLKTVLPPPPAVLDPALGTRRCLIPSLRARRRLDPGLRWCRRHPLPQAVDLYPTSLKARHRHPLPATIDLNPISLRARRHHPLPAAIDPTSLGERRCYRP
jgi:hypothetical protein